MKCDIIELKLILSTNYQKMAEYYVNSEVSVNGIKFSGYFDYLSLLEDTHLMHNDNISKPYDFFRSNESEYAQYNRSTKRYNGILSYHYFDSCSCGHAGCAGIYNGIRIYKKKKYFKYVAKKSDGYDNGILETGKWNLTFTKDNILEIREYICEFFIKNETLLVDYPGVIERCVLYKSKINL